MSSILVLSLYPTFLANSSCDIFRFSLNVFILSYSVMSNHLLTLLSIMILNVM
uniref:Uncharacterized protein n=1 Tax=Podoviridae sp. ctCmm1 TaxID=2825231 RepID=A0A8S5TUX4_9CAUD|nr:MAG TPA: hypothetical protein [Podoviridae sp. ctCmm1]